MRCLGRSTIRPAPSSNQTSVTFKVGTPVDAWWSDGWWEGVIAVANDFGDGPLQVYFPGTLNGKSCAIIIFSSFSPFLYLSLLTLF